MSGRAPTGIPCVWGQRRGRGGRGGRGARGERGGTPPCRRRSASGGGADAAFVHSRAARGGAAPHAADAAGYPQAVGAGPGGAPAGRAHL